MGKLFENNTLKIKKNLIEKLKFIRTFSFSLQKVPQVVENFESLDPQKKATAEREWWQLHNDVQKTLQIVSRKKFAEDKAHYYWKSGWYCAIRWPFNKLNDNLAECSFK